MPFKRESKSNQDCAGVVDRGCSFGRNAPCERKEGSREEGRQCSGGARRLGKKGKVSAQSPTGSIDK